MTLHDRIHALQIGEDSPFDKLFGSAPAGRQSTETSDFRPGHFDGKAAQMDLVMDILDHTGFIPEPLIELETRWFYNSLGIDDTYFAKETPENIASSIHTLYAAKVSAFARRDPNGLQIQLEQESEDHALYIDTSVPGIADVSGPQYEKRIDEKYLSGDGVFRVETFRSPVGISSEYAGKFGFPIESTGKDDGDESGDGNGTNSSLAQLRLYFVTRCNFPTTTNQISGPELAKIADSAFWESATDRTKAIYQRLLRKAANRTGPVLEYYDLPDPQEKRLVIAYPRGSAPNYFSALSDLYHYYGLTSRRKYVEQFANGYSVISLYLAVSPNGNGNRNRNPNSTNGFPPINQSIHQIVKEASLLYCLPRNRFAECFAEGKLSLQETVYAHCVSIFVSHFVNRLGPEYRALCTKLDNSDPAEAELLDKVKTRLRTETYTPEQVAQILENHLPLVAQLYAQFADVHYIQSDREGGSELPTLSYQRLTAAAPLSDEELAEKMRVPHVTAPESRVLSAVAQFNAHVTKTNFYTPTKVALAFRISPQFLPRDEYPTPLFGMFLVVGAEFRGFHLRFRDVARGGVRLVLSRSAEAYAANRRQIFDENYALAATQQRKNKDIAEGGSKGVVLVDFGAESRAEAAFKQYVDALLDLLLPGQSPGIKERLVEVGTFGIEDGTTNDSTNGSELLFMGPDEGTAGFVDWATIHAQKRGAPFWRSFFTGKSPKLGGIPHDVYGMTSLSVREYVEGVYRKLGIDGSKLRKLQTGGPDGDLGSNEIKLSTEMYVAIVDGSGVLCDINGLQKQELIRLAEARITVANYNSELLSENGFFVPVEAANYKLPTGEIVADGFSFRNEFHLRTDFGFDVFVPCGGRPNSIDIQNVNRLIRDGKSTIKIIVEGANLFISQPAKIRLESAGCIVYKDASTNKGGVTSSSLEVLAALALSETEFRHLMCVPENGTEPQFYRDYVKEVQKRIKENARLEFESLWRENAKTGKPRSVLSDEISGKINELSTEIAVSRLWQDYKFRSYVLKQALPRLLVQTVGLSVISERVPESYLRALFGSFLAGRFVYKVGVDANPFAFFEFVMEETEKAAAEAAVEA